MPQKASFSFIVLFLLIFKMLASELYKPVLIFKNNNSAIFNLNTETDHLRYLSPAESLDGDHGCISLDKPEYVEMEYMRMIMGSLLLNPKPNNILIIGLGVGILPRTFNYILNETQIDCVEIDPDIIDLASEYFYFKQSDKIKVYIQDGYDYIMNTNQTYDFIIIDAFSTGWCAPDSFINIKFVKKVKELLNWNGIVMVNTISDCDKHFYDFVIILQILFGFFVVFIIFL